MNPIMVILGFAGVVFCALKVRSAWQGKSGVPIGTIIGPDAKGPGQPSWIGDWPARERALGKLRCSRRRQGEQCGEFAVFDSAVSEGRTGSRSRRWKATNYVFSWADSRHPLLRGDIDVPLGL